MERLTYFDGGKWRLKIGDTEYSGKAVDRLAAYEDTGLEPKDIVALTRHPDFAIADYYKSLGLTMERITELAQADREGRCVVLPCKVGQKVKVDVRTWETFGTTKLLKTGNS